MCKRVHIKMLEHQEQYFISVSSVFVQLTTVPVSDPPALPHRIAIETFPSLQRGSSFSCVVLRPVALVSRQLKKTRRDKSRWNRLCGVR